jgi:hypothetical protein
VNFGVIGYGYWGPNIVRNLTSIEEDVPLAVESWQRRLG